jgi:hypothetical protein
MSQPFLKLTPDNYAPRRPSRANVFVLGIFAGSAFTVLVFALVCVLTR